MAGGIRDVQESLAPKYLFNYPAEPQSELAEEQLVLGLNALTLFQHTLDVPGHVASAEEVYDREPGRVPVVEHMLESIARSPSAAYTQKSDLIQTWVEASSSGQGRIYPVGWVARHMAASLLQELSGQGWNTELWRLSGDIDDGFWSVRALKKLNGSRPVQSVRGFIQEHMVAYPQPRS